MTRLSSNQGPNPDESWVNGDLVLAPAQGAPGAMAPFRAGTSGIADVDKLIATTVRMAEQAVLHHTLTLVHAGEVKMETETLLDHWKDQQRVEMPDPFFLVQNRSALLSLFVDRYQTFAFDTFHAYAQAHGLHSPPERGWFSAAIKAIDPHVGVWPQVWDAAPGQLSDFTSFRASARRVFLEAQEAVIEKMATAYLDTYLAQDSVQDFDSVFPLLDKVLRTAPHQQKLLDWLTACAETPTQLGSLFELELWDAAFLRFAGDITDENADPTERPTRSHSQASGWSFPEELLFGKVLIQLLERAQSELGVSPEDFLADVFHRLLRGNPPRSLNFLLETYLFQIEKLLEKGSLPTGTFGAMEAHLKAVAHELFLRAPEPLAADKQWCRSLGDYALMLLQEIIVLSHGWYPPTPQSMAEIFALSTAKDTDPYLRIAARSALASFVPRLLDQSMQVLQSPAAQDPTAAGFVLQMRDCIGLLAQAAQQAPHLKSGN